MSCETATNRQLYVYNLSALTRKCMKVFSFNFNEFYITEQLKIRDNVFTNTFSVYLEIKLE